MRTATFTDAEASCLRSVVKSYRESLKIALNTRRYKAVHGKMIREDLLMAQVLEKLKKPRKT